MLMSHDVLLCEAFRKETKAPGDVDECEQLLDTFQVQHRITIENTFHELFRSRAYHIVTASQVTRNNEDSLGSTSTQLEKMAPEAAAP